MKAVVANLRIVREAPKKASEREKGSVYRGSVDPVCHCVEPKAYLSALA